MDVIGLTIGQLIYLVGIMCACFSFGIMAGMVFIVKLNEK